jgi:hypothetical protein
MADFFNQSMQVLFPVKANWIIKNRLYLDIMKYLSVIILFAVACGSSKNNTSSNSTNSGPSDNIIQLKVNEEKTIQLPTVASNGRQMEFTLSDSSVAKVSRKEVVSTYDSTGLRPGDPVLANWMIKGLKRGTTTLKFTGSGSEKNNSANLRLRNIRIDVSD